MDDNVNSATGETIASFDSDTAHDVAVLESDDDAHKVQLPDGSIVSTTNTGLDELRDMDWKDYLIEEDWSKKPWESDPLPDREPRDPIGVVRRTQPRTQTKLKYECPNCGGRFSSWHRESGDIGEDDTYHCPFCMKQRGEFGPEDDEERIRELVREAIEEANRNSHRLGGR